MNRTNRIAGCLIAAGMLYAGRAWAQTDSATSPATSPATPRSSSRMSELFPDSVVAKGKGFEIKRSQFDDTVTSIKASAIARGQNILPEQMAMLEKQVLENLVRIQLLLTKATAEDKTKGKETCDKRFEEIKTRAGSEDTLNRQLKSVGTTQEELKAKMTDECTAEVVLDHELKVQVTDDEIKKFYEDNPAEFEQPEMVRISHILLATKDPSTGTELPEDKKAAKRRLVEDLLKRAKAGEDFEKLVKQYSEDPVTKDKGGEYTFARASADPRRAMVKEFEDAAFRLKTNELSEIVTTQYGFHIIKLLEKIPAHKTPLTEISSKIKDHLKQVAIQKQLPDYIARLKKDANVEVLDDRLKPMEAPALSSSPAATDSAKKPQ
jgi:peptidyl-prolyl cis-trans isomerase C